MAKLFFSVDVHGAESVWRKWLKVPEIYGIDAMLLCGDLTGKSLVPLIELGGGKYTGFYFGRNWDLNGETELGEMERRIHDAGAYTLRCSQDEVKDLQEHPAKVEKMMMEMITGRMRDWMEMLLEAVDVSRVDTIVMPGNDDDQEIDDVIKSFGAWTV
jgi:Icc-related predicted phosphoesterase